MADFAPAGAAETLYLAGAVGGHVVMMNIAFKFLFTDAVDRLSVAESAESRNRHDLSLAAGEHRRTVSAGKDADFAPNGADLRVGSAVGTDTLVDYLVTQDLLHEIVKNGVNIRCAVGIFLGKMRNGFSLDLFGANLAFLTVKCVKLPFDLCTRKFNDLCLQLLIGSVNNGNDFFLADFRLNRFDPFNDLLDVFMAEKDRIEHFLFGNLVCARFNHHNCVRRARNGKVQAAAAALLKIGIDDILPVNIADADRAYGAGKGSFADGQRN